MDETLDLDLDNYTLDDLLNLFRLSPAFTEGELKASRARVTQVHPDKSGLDPKYFDFFNRAHQSLVRAHKFSGQGRGRKCARRALTEYDVVLGETNPGVKEAVAGGEKGEFNAKFNEMFEKHAGASRRIAEGAGHGEWLASADDMCPEGLCDMERLKAQRKAARQAQLVVRTAPEGLLGSGLAHTSLEEDSQDGGQPGGYGFGLCGNLVYQDVRTAHVETVMPFTEDDAALAASGRARTVEALERERASAAREAVPSVNESRRLLDSVARDEDAAAIRRGYKLAEEAQRGAEASRRALGAFLQLRDSPS